MYTGQEILYFEDFKGEITCSELIRLCNGRQTINKKFKGAMTLPHDIRVWIESNLSIKDVFKNVDERLVNSLKNRFTEYYMNKLHEIE